MLCRIYDEYTNIILKKKRKERNHNYEYALVQHQETNICFEFLDNELSRYLKNLSRNFFYNKI